MTMIELTSMIGRYFAEHNINTDGFTLILNFKDADGGVRIEAALLREFDHLRNPFLRKRLDILSDFEVNGIRVKIESPVHEPA